ncbi:MAG TPA: PAS domain-containing protein, partial [Flavisolibacter sp.]|nr:PAS domain-containing protein [Flavisolibacter sp.]
VRNEQLAEIQEYSESVFTTIRESLLILDKELRVKNANLVFYKTFNMREEDVQGQLLFELHKGFLDIPGLRKVLKEDILVTTQIFGLEIEYFFPTIGEKIFLFNIRKIVQKIRSQELILVAIEDITEHRLGQKTILEREAWFRNMADNAPVMIWVTDIVQNCTFFNKTWLEFRGSTLDREIGKNWMEAIHPDDIQKCKLLFEQSFIDKKPFDLKHRLLNKEGDYKSVHTKAKPGYDPNGIFTGFIGSTIEISE